MRVLAIDTALGACAAAVLDSQRGAILASESLSMLRGHAEAVMPLIARVMDAARCEFAELDRIAVTVGPGSFTGLRVGISAARGIALAAGKPAIGLSHAVGARRAACRGARRSVHHRGDRCAQRAGLFPCVRAERRDHRVAAARSRARRGARRAGRPDRDHRLGRGAGRRALAERIAGRRASRCMRAPDIGWVARLGAAAQDEGAAPKPLYLRRPDARPQDAGRLPRR